VFETVGVLSDSGNRIKLILKNSDKETK